MTALVSALRAGRTRALVQRPRRKIHLASIAAGEPVWLTFCDREVQADGATFWAVDDAQIGDTAREAEERVDDVCAHCYRLLLLATLISLEHALPAPLEHDAETPARRWAAR